MKVCSAYFWAAFGYVVCADGPDPNEGRLTKLSNESGNNPYKPWWDHSKPVKMQDSRQCCDVTTNTCIQYSAQIAASNAEEAILNFRDPTMPSDFFRPDPFTNETYHDGERCTSQECVACSLILIRVLRNQNVISEAEAVSAKQKLGLPDEENSTLDLTCTRYAHMLSNSHLSLNDFRLGQNAFVKAAVRQLNQTFRDIDDRLLGDKSSVSALIQMSRLPDSVYNREKRATSVAAIPQWKQQSIVGTRFPMNCAKRGEPITQTSTRVGLCSVCWVWRQLPDGYFPKFVNELACMSDSPSVEEQYKEGTDTDEFSFAPCIAGFGGCFEIKRSLDVLNAERNVETINIAMSCDCQINQGSALHNIARV